MKQLNTPFKQNIAEQVVAGEITTEDILFLESHRNEFDLDLLDIQTFLKLAYYCASDNAWADGVLTEEELGDLSVISQVIKGVSSKMSKEARIAEVTLLKNKMAAHRVGQSLPAIHIQKTENEQQEKERLDRFHRLLPKMTPLWAPQIKMGS